MTAGVPHPDVAATAHGIESFGRAVLALLECRRCFVFTRSRLSGFAGQAVRLGVDSTRPSVDAITRLAQREEWQASGLFAIDHTDLVAIELLGRSREEPEHGLVGRLPAGHGDDLIFLAGWRRSPFPAGELACVARAADVIWSAMQGSQRRHPPPASLDTLLDEVAAPAYVVDHRWRVLETNEAGRQLLAAKGPVHLDHGVLCGPSSLANNLMQQGLRDAIASRPERGWGSTIIPLSTDHHSFAFAWIGVAPFLRDDANRVLVVIPQIDPAAGAKRIAAAFALPWAEERIVMLLLRGDTPARIGHLLDLTEATVRTYIKRIMLKLGINRQIEFFRLYILTQSPFPDGGREPGLATDTQCRVLSIKRDRVRQDGA